MSQPYLSVIIPAYNEAPRIEDTLRSVVGYLHSRDYRWEVVVVDDGSTDSTARLSKPSLRTIQEFARSVLPTVARVGPSTGVWFGQRRNTGYM